MFKFLIALFFMGAVSAQRSEFVDYVLDLQYAVGYIHDEVQDTTWQSRYDMSDELTDIVKDSVTEIRNSLTSYLTMFNRYNNYIEEVRTDENAECIDAAAANWTTIQRQTGAAIGACGSNPMETLHENVFGYHQFVNSNRQLKFDAQNIVLSSFRKVNVFTNVMDLSPTVERDINTIHETFINDVHPGLTERLAAFATLKEEIPTQVHDCIAEALNNFSGQAGTIVANARECGV